MNPENENDKMEILETVETPAKNITEASTG